MLGNWQGRLFAPFIFLCLFICVHVSTCMPQHVWRSEVDWQESILSFSHVAPRDQTQEVGLGKKGPSTC